MAIRHVIITDKCLIDGFYKVELSHLLQVGDDITYCYKIEKEEKDMKIIVPTEKTTYPTEVYINDSKYVPEHEQKSFLRMDEKEMKAILEVQSIETVIKLAKACHGIMYHQVRK